MFGFEKSHDAQSNLSEGELLQVEESIKGTILENDPATLRMIETGFVSPNGSQHDPSEFIEQRKAILEAGDAGASAHELSEEDMVQHSKGPEQEHGSLSQQ